MTDRASPPPESTNDTTQWGWITVSLGAHMAWGIYPVLARYLQTVSDVPSLSILSAGNLVALILVGGFLLRRSEWSMFRQPITWVFMLFVVIRAITNILSARYTLSIYVQLVTQLTPFLVIFFSVVLFREKIPRFTIPAVALALIGSIMIIGTDFTATATSDSSRQDLLGIGLALISITALSIYMVLIRHSVKQHISAEALLLGQLITLIVVMGVASWLIGEDWTQYTHIGLKDWVVFFAFVLLVFVGANLGQISAIQHIGAPLVSSMLATRLLSALLFGALLLNENLNSIWQVIGVVIVLVTITWYLHQQNR